MASSINASTTAGVVTTADTSGVLNIQTAGTTAISIDASQAVTVQGLTVGRGAGAVSTNTAVGAGALTANTTGFENSAGGRQALYSNTTGNYNTAFGHQAGYAIATTNQSTCVGSYAGLSTTGGLNSFFGYGAGNTITTGTNNTIIGSFDGNGDGLDIRTVSNYVVLADGSGNRQITMKEGQTLALDSAVPNAGTGITFPATQSASSNANTLDDYEEGTWTPVAARFTGGNITAVYGGSNVGKYTKIGRIVILECSLDITSVSSQGSSLSQIKGLPFTPASSYLGNGAVFQNTAVTTLNIVSGATNSGDNCIYLHESGNSATLASFDWKAGALTITISYSI